jgi:polyphosphate kinase
MVRNFDHRIEVACPVYDKDIQKELMDILKIQLSDNVKARVISHGEANKYKLRIGKNVRSQIEIYNYFKEKLSIDNG